jgi:hypothetical protein
VVLLRYWADLPVAEVARLVHRPQGTVKRRLHEARAQLARDPREGASMPDLTPDRSLRRRPPLGALERVQRAGRRRRRTILLGAASALVLLAAVPVALVLPVESRETLLTEADSAPSAVPGDPAPSTGTAAPAAAESCPAVLDNLPGRPPTVPAPPPVGWHGALVPGQAPVAAAICRYSDASAFSGAATGREPPEQVALESERQLTGGLDDVVSDLSVPAGTEVGGCTLVGGPIVPYLLRLTYPTGTVWVGSRSDLNSCELVTNGAFTSAVYVGTSRRLVRGRRLGPDAAGGRRPPTAARSAPVGRAGQERSWSRRWTTLTVCLQDGAGGPPAWWPPSRPEPSPSC